jgi:hypothetical protein
MRAARVIPVVRRSRKLLDGDRLQGESAVLFDHAAADAHFGASVFSVRRLAAMGGEQSLVKYWQAKRGGGTRGIIEIVGDAHD